MILIFLAFYFSALELTFLTSDKQHAGTTQNAWIVLEGEERRSQEYKIENSARNKVLRRGQTDTFKFVTKSLGSLTHVTIGHRKREGSKRIIASVVNAYLFCVCPLPELPS